MNIASRSYSSGSYRYGFNGKENDPEDGWQDYGERMYDPRLARFFSEDPITDEYPELTPYQFASNTPIQSVDLDGLEEIRYNLSYDDEGNTKLKLTSYKSHDENGEPLPQTIVVTYNSYEYSFHANEDDIPFWNYGNHFSVKKFGDFLKDPEPYENSNVTSHNIKHEALLNAPSFLRGIRATKTTWKGPVNYSKLKQPRKVGPGFETTAAQRKRILEYNKKQNGGVLRSDEDGSIVNPPSQSKKGVPADMNQAEIDHIKAKSKSGSNSNSNLRVISKKQNIKKRDK
jgi:RHS repeat-associated protein